MKYVEEYHIKVNGTILILGEIVDLFIEDDLIENDGFLDLLKAETVAVNGLYCYSLTVKNERLEYQRPNQ